jgi:hypothetical protein
LTSIEHNHVRRALVDARRFEPLLIVVILAAGVLSAAAGGSALEARRALVSRDLLRVIGNDARVMVEHDAARRVGEGDLPALGHLSGEHC